MKESSASLQKKYNFYRLDALRSISQTKRKNIIENSFSIIPKVMGSQLTGNSNLRLLGSDLSKGTIYLFKF